MRLALFLGQDLSTARHTCRRVTREAGSCLTLLLVTTGGLLKVASCGGKDGKGVVKPSLFLRGLGHGQGKVQVLRPRRQLRRLLQRVRCGHHGQNPQPLLPWTPGKVFPAKTFQVLSSLSSKPAPLNSLHQVLCPLHAGYQHGLACFLSSRKPPAGLPLPCTINMNIVHIRVFPGALEKKHQEVSSPPENALRERPLCDCPEPCGCYAEGYAAGKDKAYFEMLANLERPPHTEGYAMPALLGQAGMPAEGADTDGQKLARDLRAGGGLGPGEPRQPGLKRRPFPGECRSSF